jgi:acetyl-CoA synthetase
MKGEVPVAYVVLKSGYRGSEELSKELVEHISKMVGPIAKPKQIFFVDELPKTRSGKIMRRILKALITRDKIGDTTTLLNPEVVESLKKIVGYPA